ncbi:hypothetical protein C8R43DRAFT_828444, partial [Mycena crocata]
LNSLSGDPQNHTIPTIALLPCNEVVFIVQPRWGDHPLHPSLNLSEWVEVTHQLLEGLAFMHERGVGH